jgi:hypothetical protein
VTVQTLTISRKQESVLMKQIVLMLFKAEAHFQIRFTQGPQNGAPKAWSHPLWCLFVVIMCRANSKQSLAHFEPIA